MTVWRMNQRSSQLPLSQMMIVFPLVPAVQQSASLMMTVSVSTANRWFFAHLYLSFQAYAYNYKHLSLAKVGPKMSTPNFDFRVSKFTPTR